MIYCIPLDTATEEFYASVARGAALNKVRKGPK